MKKLMLIIPALMVFMTAAAGLTRPPVPEESLTPHVLCGIQEDTADPCYPYVYAVVIAEENDAVPTDLLGPMPYTDTDGNVVMLDIEWDTEDESLLDPGYHTITGTPILPEGTVLADGFDPTISYPMFRKGTVLEVIPIQEHLLSDRLIAQGSSDPLSEISISTKGRRAAVGENGFLLTTDEWVWDWDASAVDTSVPGAYPITGTLVSLPDWLTVPEESCTVTHTVYVMRDDAISLSAPHELTRNGALIFRWLYDCADVTSAVLQYDNAGEWTACPQKWYSFSMGGMFSSPKLSLFLADIPAGEYTMRMTYTVSGSEEERVSDILHITVPDNIAEIAAASSGRIPDELHIGGDRDGGDFGGTVLPDREQTLPDDILKKITSDFAYARLLVERVTANSTTVSGLRLAIMQSSGDTVLFEKNGVSVEIPSALLTDLNLSYTDSLTVTITHPDPYTVSVSVQAADAAVRDLTGTVVSVPWDASDGTCLTCSDIFGIRFPEVTFFSETGIASFEITSAGTYILSAELSDTKQSVPDIRIPASILIEKVRHG